MPYAAQVTQKVFDEQTQTWVDSPRKILLTAENVCWAVETDDGDTHVTVACGTVVRVNQTLEQMEDWLNGPRDVKVIP